MGGSMTDGSLPTVNGSITGYFLWDYPSNPIHRWFIDGLEGKIPID